MMKDTALKAFYISNNIALFKIINENGYVIKELKDGKQGFLIGCCDNSFNLIPPISTDKEKQVKDILFDLKFRFLDIDKLMIKYGLTSQINNNSISL